MQTTTEAVQAALDAELTIASRHGGILDDDFARFTMAVLERLHDGAATMTGAPVPFSFPSADSAYYKAYPIATTVVPVPSDTASSVPQVAAQHVATDEDGREGAQS